MPMHLQLKNQSGVRNLLALYLMLSHIQIMQDIIIKMIRRSEFSSSVV